MRTRGLAPLGSQSMRETCATLPIYQTSQIFRGFLTKCKVTKKGSFAMHGSAKLKEGLLVIFFSIRLLMRRNTSML